LGGDVFGGQVASALSSTAAFEQIVREKADVSPNVLWLDGLDGSDGRAGQSMRIDGGPEKA